MADEARLAAEITATAAQAYNKAAEIVQRRRDNAEQSLRAAHAAFQRSDHQAGKVGGADPADRPALLAETAKAAAEALTESYKAVEATYSGTPNADSKDEWKECRATIDRFDKLLVDLRKTGFGIITGLVAAATYLFKDAPTGVRTSIL